MHMPWGKIAATPVMVACLVYAGWVATHPAEPANEYASQIGLTTTGRLPVPTPTVTPGPELAVFLGDSYVGGAAGIPAKRAFADLTCADLGWTCKNLGWGGTGYLAGVDSGHDYATRAGGKEDDAVRYVVVSGGRNDISKGFARRDVVDAIDQTMSEVRGSYPNAKVFVLEPFWINNDPPPELVQVRKDVKEAAERIRATWIPTASWLKWSLISRDGVHPTAKGHQVLEAHLVEELQDLA